MRFDNSKNLLVPGARFAKLQFANAPSAAKAKQIIPSILNSESYQGFLYYYVLIFKLRKYQIFL